MKQNSQPFPTNLISYLSPSDEFNFVGLTKTETRAKPAPRAPELDFKGGRHNLEPGGH